MRLLAIFAIAAHAYAVCHVITPGGAGAKDGSNWSNACQGFSNACAVAALTRGDTYYLAAGAYGSIILSTANSGTTVITLKSPTPSDHCSDTGWDAGTMVGSAVFASSGNTPAIDFTSDYWTLDGAYGSGSITASDYGINATYGGGAITTAIFRVGYSGNARTGVTLRHAAVVGSFGAPAYDGSGTCEDAVSVYTGAASPNYLFEYNLFTGSVDHLNLNSVSSVTAQYNVGYRNYTLGGCHGDAISFSNGASDIILRYNQWRSSAGTAVYNMPCGTCSTSSNISIYGERIYWVDSDECAVETGDHLDPSGCGVGNGVLWGSAGTGITGDFVFTNNTIDNLTGIHFGGGSWTIPQNSADTEWGDVVIRNNLITNSTAMGAAACPADSTCSSFTWSHQAYYNTTNTADIDADKQTLVANPFVNVAAQNFHLVADTAAWSALLSPLNSDPDGTTRTSSRGAYQFLPPSAGTRVQGGELSNGVLR